jgi:hypothetical protein
MTPETSLRFLFWDSPKVSDNRGNGADGVSAPDRPLTTNRTNGGRDTMALHTLAYPISRPQSRHEYHDALMLCAVSR